MTREQAAPEAIEAPALLRLMWLASPALPVGGFSYSDGLEAAVEAGCAADEAGTGVWLSDQLHLVVARADLPLVAAATEAWRRDDRAEVEALNRWTLATRETAEQRQQAEQMGRSMADWLRVQAAGDARRDALAALQPAPAWPVAYALAGALSGAATPQVMLAYAFGWAENAVAAAVRAVPLGQSAGQRILARLAQEIPGAVEQALQCPAEDRQAFAPMLAVLSSRHETQYSRLFRS
jgi:urease accessory protein